MVRGIFLKLKFPYASSSTQGRYRIINNLYIYKKTPQMTIYYVTGVCMYVYTVCVQKSTHFLLIEKRYFTVARTRNV